MFTDQLKREKLNKITNKLIVVFGNYHDNLTDLANFQKVIDRAYKVVIEKQNINIAVGLEMGNSLLQDIRVGRTDIKQRPNRKHVKDFDSNDTFKGEREFCEHMDSININVCAIDTLVEHMKADSQFYRNVYPYLDKSRISAMRENEMVANCQKMLKDHDIVFLYVGMGHVARIAEEIKEENVDAKVLYVIDLKVADGLDDFKIMLKEIEGQMEPDSFEGLPAAEQEEIAENAGYVRTMVPALERSKTLLDNPITQRGKVRDLELYLEKVLDKLYPSSQIDFD